MLRQNTHKFWKAAAVGGLTLLLAILCVVLACTALLYKQSHAFLNAVQLIKVGERLDSHTVERAKYMKAIVYVKSPHGSAVCKYFYVDPSRWADKRYASEFMPVSFDRCMIDFCAISFPASKLQPDRVYDFVQVYPSTLLPIFHWFYSKQTLHRVLPLAWLDPVTITVKKGTVIEMSIKMRSEDAHGQIQPQAEVLITAEQAGTSPFEVTPTVVSTGPSQGTVQRLLVKVSGGASPDQQADALNFNLRCLLPGGYCSACDMLPTICRKYLGHAVGGWPRL